VFIKSQKKKVKIEESLAKDKNIMQDFCKIFARFLKSSYLWMPRSDFEGIS